MYKKNGVWYQTRSFSALDSERPLTIIAQSAPLLSRSLTRSQPRFHRVPQPRNSGRSAVGRNIRSAGYHGAHQRTGTDDITTRYRLECWNDAEKKTADPSKKEIIDSSLDALTMAEFKRLKEQLRGVSSSLGHKIRGVSFKSPVKEESNPILYRSQLAESMKTFRLQAKNELDAESRKAELTRCRPIIGTKPICTRPQTAPSTRAPRPPSAVRPASQMDSQPMSVYDSLTNQNIFNLADKVFIYSGYGDGDHRPGDEVRADDSDDEDIPEPEVDKNRKIPEFPTLRPDTLENLYMSEGERDYEKYDFDATKVDIPQYEFKYSGPDEFEKVDFEDLASYNKDWRQMTKRRPKETELELLIDRFIELERLVVKTESWEDKHRDRCRMLSKQKQEQNLQLRAKGRVISARVRDKKCCKNCLQVICAGDCPLKKTSLQFCIHCRQAYCSGTCVHLGYNAYSRDTASESDTESEEEVSRKPRPKSCQTCRRKDTNVKVMNTNHILQGRPKSGLATYNRGKSANDAKDLLNDGHECHETIQEDFNKLNIVPGWRPSTGTKRPPRGRNALVPGKSYFSQRHDSISVDKRTRVKSAPPGLRVRSARGRRSRPGSQQPIRETVT